MWTSPVRYSQAIDAILGRFVRVRNLRNLRLAIAAIICPLILSACQPKPSDRVYIVAIDRSGSTTGFRLDQLHAINQARKAAISQHAQLELWYFDRTARRIYGPHIPSDARAIALAKANFLVPDADHPLIGTRPDSLLAALDQEVPQLKSKDVRLLIFSDGDNDFPGDAQNLRRHAEQLGTLNRFHAAVFGEHSENDSLWRNLIADRLQQRLTIAHPDNLDGAFSSIVAN